MKSFFFISFYRLVIRNSAERKCHKYLLIHFLFDYALLLFIFFVLFHKTALPFFC
jgi:hypothetical protein